MQEENNPDKTPEAADPADRGIPSVAMQPRGQILVMTLFLALALIAMIYVVVDGLHKNAAPPLVAPEETVFRSPRHALPPFIEEEYAPDRMPLGPPPLPPNDQNAAQRERALQEEALRIAREQQQKKEERLRSPQLVYDQPDRRGTAVTAQAGNASAYGDISPLAGGSDNPDLAFANQASAQDVETAQARQLRDLDALIPQGTMIAGILETAIQSDLPGMIRAVVSENVYSFDNARLLIPKGSRLVGLYRAGLVRGQARVFVIWNRLIRNDGVIINIGSFGTDSLGRSGLGGDVDTHFFERFGSSLLLSLIDSGLQAGVQSMNDNNSATVALDTGHDFSKSAEIALQNSVAIPPTVHVDQGARINVFVGKDLDFSSITASGRK